jgi:hypothetical protein
MNETNQTNQTDQNDLASWLVVGAGCALFFLAFLVHSFVPILLIVPLALIYMARKKKPEQQQYYVPSREHQASTSRARYSEAVPKEVSPAEYEQPMAQYPEQQMPPMS